MMNQAQLDLPNVEQQLKFPDGFWLWINENKHIYDEFEKRALEMTKYRERYSARTIVEVLRWNSDLRQGCPLFKISNNMIPGMARLWMMNHGRDNPGFFQLKPS
jgi:hypothetical protein